MSFEVQHLADWDCIHLFVQPGNTNEPSSLLFPFLERRLVQRTRAEERSGSGVSGKPTQSSLSPQPPQRGTKTGAAEHQDGVHHHSGRSRTLVPLVLLVLSDENRAGLDMQIYVHTVCVLHRLMVDDKKEVKCVVLCMACCQVSSLCCEDSAQTKTHKPKGHGLVLENSSAEMKMRFV